MVQAIINISEEANHILSIVKAKHRLKDKSAAIDFVALTFGMEIMEPELKPEYIRKLFEIEKEKSIKLKSLGDLRKRHKQK